MIPRFEETLERSADARSSLKTLTLPTKPVHTTSSLVAQPGYREISGGEETIICDLEVYPSSPEALRGCCQGAGPAICAQLFKSTTAKRERCGSCPPSENLGVKTVLSPESNAREDGPEECSSLKEALEKRP
ncbi:hypothetical protein DPX16_18487 [Anabarilius grahami]|uniref:Uncharacterized protein n=1 Tax=Anabarilius grahami TaxID=495550 RepID=A0A3N0YET0_ANAGA|nr:hypothetical protein DPX16_18487 [Anabarilius grahami]